MAILDGLRRKKERKAVNKESEHAVITDEQEQERLLKEEIETFFPKSGCWESICFKQPEGLVKTNLPCHLRDNAWMSAFLHENLLFHKGINIPEQAIKNFMDNSDRFNELRHNYELEIVKWQIDHMRNGGENWLMPEGYHELSMWSSSDTVEIFRGGVVKTLTSIGMDSEVIEEGIEKNADMFREKYILTGFQNEYDPFIYSYGSPSEPVDEKHKQNWLKAKRYEYYCNHKQSVDKYGKPHPDMLMTPKEVENLQDVLPAQNEARKKVVDKWLAEKSNGSAFNIRFNVKRPDTQEDNVSSR